MVPWGIGRVHSQEQRTVGHALTLEACPHRRYGSGTIASITEADLRRWRADLLSAGVSPVTTAKAYRLIKSALATAVDDGLIRCNPCRIKGASVEKSPERLLGSYSYAEDVAAKVVGLFMTSRCVI